MPITYKSVAPTAILDSSFGALSLIVVRERLMTRGSDALLFRA